MPRILIVDDEPSLRTTLAANLELEGFEVVEAADAASALERTADGPFDLVLSDIRMPGLSGVDLLERIKSTSPDLPVILMTAFTEEEAIARAIAEGVFTVLAKPFDIESAANMLRRAIDRPVVVVVDDLESVADATAAALGEIGLRAVAAYDVESALRLVREHEVDVCLTDLVMPASDGVDLMKRLREADAKVTVIVFTGAPNSDGLMRTAASMGAYGCMRKPLDPLELARTIAGARRGQ